MNNDADWCLIMSLRLYIAISRCWHAREVSSALVLLIRPNHPGGIYREQNNRGYVSQSKNTDVTITDKTDWTTLILLSLLGLFVVVI